MPVRSSGTLYLQLDFEASGINSLGAWQEFVDYGTPYGNNTNLKSFYRGGTFVPNFSVNSGVPTSGAISLNQLRGARNIYASLSGANTSGRLSSTSPTATGSVNFRLTRGAAGAISTFDSYSSGTLTSTSGAIASTQCSGIYGTRIFSYRMTTTGSALASGTTGSWVNISAGSSAVWTLSSTFNTGAKTTNCTLDTSYADALSNPGATIAFTITFVLNLRTTA